MFLKAKKAPEGVKYLTVNGVALTAETIGEGSYPITWPIIMYTNGYPAPGSYVHQYVTLHLRREGQAIIDSGPYFPVTAYKK